MRTLDLPRVPRPACSCRVFVPDVIVPTGQALCWLCAHAVTAHGADATDADAIASALAGCACSAADVYPPDVTARRRAGGIWEAAQAEATLRSLEDVLVGSTDPKASSMRRHEIRAALRASTNGLGAATFVKDSFCTVCDRPARRSGRCGYHDGSHKTKR